MYADQIPSRVITDQGKQMLFFSGTAYLGIHARQEFRDLVFEGIQRFGTNYGASRLGNVSIPVFNQAEEKLAAWLGAPSGLLVSSGTLAGRLILEVLHDYEQHYSPNAHIAINPFYKKHQPELFDAWIEQTIHEIGECKRDKHLITFNSIDPLTASRPALNWIAKLPANKDILLLADDSHGIGVMGEQGRGVYPELNRLHPNSLMIASLGKAMGLPAGLIAGSPQLLSRIKSHPLFGGSSPMVPAYAHAYIYGDSIYQQAYKQMIENMSYCKRHLIHTGLFSFADQIPIFSTQRHELAAYLEKQRIRISHFAYPSPEDRLYTRVVVNGLHTMEDLEQIRIQILKFKEMDSTLNKGIA